MNEPALAPMHSWLVAPLEESVSEAIRRLRRAPDVTRVAIMPDVHLAEDVCIGVAVGTSHFLYPQAVGGDIGCGMLAIPFDLEQSALDNPRTAASILGGLARAIPARRRHRRHSIAIPDDLSSTALSDPKLDSLRRTIGQLEFATIGSGNHFVELQADEERRVWLMVHSGSRALGPAIRDHHLGQAVAVGGGLKALDAQQDTGAAYLSDADWARRFAGANRRQIALLVEEVISRSVHKQLRWEDAIATDHNHVERESHGPTELWVHRKGAMPAGRDQLGVLPGSMGSLSYHVVGRGCAEALCSSAHGAGRILSRTAARAAITERDLKQQMQNVWYDIRLADRLRDEAPRAYKDIRAVARAQRDLVKVIRVLRPILNYKGV